MLVSKEHPRTLAAPGSLCFLWHFSSHVPADTVRKMLLPSHELHSSARHPRAHQLVLRVYSIDAGTVTEKVAGNSLGDAAAGRSPCQAVEARAIYGN